MIVESITQPEDDATIDAVARALRSCAATSVDVAAAYITAGGASDLIAVMSDSLGASWSGVRKRWITSFDYLRTDPMALELIQKLPKSQVRIHDAPTVLSNKGSPSIPFHPKAFLFRGKHSAFVIAGSGNVSRSGLRRGHEVGVMIGSERSTSADPDPGVLAISAFQGWFTRRWDAAHALEAKTLRKYTALFEDVPNLSNPTATEDDVVVYRPRANQLTFEQLKKLRICRNFWIEAGSVTENRGPGLPGNQLMMKRLSRVYFGVVPSDVPPNTFLDSIEVAYAGNASKTCSLTFSDNGMDKLTLPIPGNGGPPMYDGEKLLFTRIEPGLFELRLASKGEPRTWLKRSKAIGGSFSMPSGRNWGVF